jgi:hypothetical protein
MGAKIDLLHKPTIFYNEFKHNILTLVNNAKKNENQNKSIQNECLVKFALINVALNDFLLIFFSLLMFINYESNYWSKSSMISLIIHNKILRNKWAVLV